MTMARPWPFVEREKSAISLGGQDEPDLSYMYGGTDGEGEPLYGTTLMASVPGVFKHKPSVGDDSVTALVDSGASGHYFGNFIIPSLKHRLLDYALLTAPRKILTAEGALLGGTSEGILQGFVTDNHGEQNLARIDILMESGIGRNLFMSNRQRRRASFPFSTSTTPGWSYPASPSHFVQKMTSIRWCLN